MIEILYENYSICIGENAIENDSLVKNSNDDDVWVHISDYPSAHGIIQNPSGKRVPKKIIKRVCCLIKSKNNRCKSMKDLQFDICPIKNVTSTNIPGRVTIKDPKLISI